MSLMTKQPDLLDDRGIEAIFIHLDKNEDLEVKRLTLKWTKECCIMHEKNRYTVKFNYFKIFIFQLSCVYKNLL